MNIMSGEQVASTTLPGIKIGFSLQSGIKKCTATCGTSHGAMVTNM